MLKSKMCLEGFTNQRSRACIDELVLSSSRYHHQVPGFDILILPSNSCFANARSKGESLINSVNLEDREIGQESSKKAYSFKCSMFP